MYRIAIPSYKRAKTINEKTLNYLINICEFDANKIDVFVANNDEYEEYKYLKNIGVNVIIGIITIKEQRLFINNYYNEGDFIVRNPGDVHQPMGANNGECICLSALEAPIKLTSPFGFLLKPMLNINPM